MRITFDIDEKQMKDMFVKQITTQRSDMTVNPENITIKCTTDGDVFKSMSVIIETE